MELEWENYLWFNGSYNKITKYCQADKAVCWDGEGEVDDKDELKDYDYEDDAAFVQLGGTWHIPTADDWRELINNCSWTWTTRNGIRGYSVESPTTGNSIFLPVIGDTSSTQGDGNSYGHYWSSTLSTWPWSAQAVQTTSSSHSVGSAPREYRLQIRPVKD